MSSLDEISATTRKTIEKRPKKGSEAENKLFFAEVKGETKDIGGGGTRSVYTCRFVNVIGPIGSETGLNGCISCKRIPGHIQHPEGGGFTDIVRPGSGFHLLL